MKKLLLLFLTLATLNVIAQDTIVPQPKKQFTLESLFSDSLNLPKLPKLNLDLNDINWKKITKFATVYGAVNGGTSLSDINRIKNVPSIINDNIKKYKLVIVLSAMAGTTDNLQKLIDGFNVYHKFMKFNFIKSLYYLMVLCANYLRK